MASNVSSSVNRRFYTHEAKYEEDSVENQFTQSKSEFQVDASILKRNLRSGSYTDHESFTGVDEPSKFVPRFKLQLLPDWLRNGSSEGRSRRVDQVYAAHAARAVEKKS